MEVTSSCPEAVRTLVQLREQGGDLRRAPRVPVRSDAALVIGDDSDEGGAALDEAWFSGDAEIGAGAGLRIELPLRAEDVSVDGLRLLGEPEHLPAVGESVELRLGLPGDDGGLLTVHGVVVRDGEGEAALRFTYLPDDARERIEAFVACFVGEPRAHRGGLRAVLRRLFA